MADVAARAGDRRIVYPAAEVIEPGVIEHTYGDRFTLGEPDGSEQRARRGAVGPLIAAG